MHPVITQAMGVQRARELQADAEAAGHFRRLRRSRRSDRTRWFTRFGAGGRAPALLPAARPLGGLADTDSRERGIRLLPEEAGLQQAASRIRQAVIPNQPGP